MKMLPSIDLKRNQLKAEETRAKNELAELRIESEKMIADVDKTLPMIANRDPLLEKLVIISSSVIEEQSFAGIKVPYLKKVIFEEKGSLLVKTSEIEDYIELLKKAIESKLRVKVMQQRVECFNKAVREITQHFNFLERILIPNAKKNIEKIQQMLEEEA